MPESKLTARTIKPSDEAVTAYLVMGPSVVIAGFFLEGAAKDYRTMAYGNDKTVIVVPVQMYATARAAIETEE